MEHIEIVNAGGLVVMTIHLGKGWFTFDADLLPSGDTFRWVQD